MKNYRHSEFDQVEKKNQYKSFFDLSHEYKTQMCFGRYYPIHWEECYPQDEFELDGEYALRFSSLYFPIQQIGTLRCDIWFAPYNILFRGDYQDNYNKTGWKGFIMGEDIELPVMDLNINGNAPDGDTDFYAGCAYPIENYLGFPMDITDRIDDSKQWSVKGSAFPAAMYLMCYDEGYRNPLWEEPQFFNLEEGDNTARFNQVKQIADGATFLDWAPTAVGALGNVKIHHEPFFAHYQKDYFTASRPEPQEGDPIKIPQITDDLPLGQQIVRDPVTGLPADIANMTSNASGQLQNSAGGVPVVIDMTESAPDIPQLRKANILQQFHERVMRFGKRYNDWIEGLFGRKAEPNVIDIPVLVGSHFGRLQISDTMTTAETSEAATGNYRGNMNFYNNGERKTYKCQDYGIMMWIVNIMPNTGYGQGIHPKWTREVSTDYPLDMFAGIGDQEIKRKELLALNVKAIWDDTDEPYNEVIGYNDRFAEVKTAYNRYFTTKDLYKSLYMGQYISTLEVDYPLMTAGQTILGASYATTNGIREVDIFNQLPIKSGASTYTDATIFAHFYLTIKVKRQLPFFSIPGKQVF